MPLAFVKAQARLSLIGRADELKLFRIEFDAGPSEQLIKKESALKVAEGETIRFGDFVHMIGADQMAGARHVLDDEGRIAWDEFADVASNHARVSVEAAAGGSRHDDANGLAFVEGLLGEACIAPVEHSR